MNTVDSLEFVSCDERTRKYILPKSVVKIWGEVSNPKSCLAKKSLQIALSEPSVTVLQNGIEGERAAVLLDFGCEFHGGIRILTAHNASGAPVRARLTFGESVSEAISHIGFKHACNDHSPRDFEVLLPRLSDLEFGQTGFRYVRIELLNMGVCLKIKSVLGVFVYRELEYIGSFECSDERLNKIYDTAAYTVHLNMQNMLWDGIKRDRLVWVGDTHPEFLAIRSLFGNLSLVFDNLRFARDEARLPAWMNGMPSYSMWWLLILRDASFAADDYTLALESREYVEELLLLLFSKINGDGTHDFGDYFLDWQTRGAPEAVAGVHALLYMAISAGAQLCRVWKNDALALRCEEYLVALKKNVPDPYTCSAANALLCLAGLDGGSVDVIARNGEYDMTTLMSYYVASALAKAGQIDKALDMIRAYYGGMLDMGATTFWEDFDMRWLENATRIDEFPMEGKMCVHSDRGQHCYKGLRHSLCHGWAVGPVAFLAEYVLGIRVTEAGGKSVHLCPMLAGLDYARGSYPTKYGKIIVEWRRAEDRTELTKFVCPDEVNVTFSDNITDRR